MTTIAYCMKRRQVAIDSRVTAGNEIVSDNAEKAIFQEGLIVFFAGTVSHVHEVIKALQTGRHKVRCSLDLSGLVWNGAALYEFDVEDGEIDWHEVIDKHGAIGSGAAYALAALDSGATPCQAIREAKRRDAMTGGKIKLHRLRAAE